MSILHEVYFVSPCENLMLQICELQKASLALGHVGQCRIYPGPDKKDMPQELLQPMTQVAIVAGFRAEAIVVDPMYSDFTFPDLETSRDVR
jgi:hypothetical protein